MSRMGFARHQTFHIRSGWLTKGLEAVEASRDIFLKKDAPEQLGIGRNMVYALRFWMRATGLTNEVNEDRRNVQQLTKLGKLVFKYDRYIEERVTLELIHYNLVKNKEESTAWHWFFSVYDGYEIEMDEFVNGLVRYAREEFGKEVALSSLKKDWACLVNTYTASIDSDLTPEDNIICPLSTLGLLKPVSDSGRYRKVAPSEGLIPEVVYCVIYEGTNTDDNRKHITIDSLITDPQGIAKVYNLTNEQVYHYLDLMQERGWLRFSTTAGLNTVTLDNDKPWSLVEEYYQKCSTMGGEVR